MCMVWEGKEVVKTGRKIIGATNPLCVTPTLALSSAIRSVPALRRRRAPLSETRANTRRSPPVAPPRTVPTPQISRVASLGANPPTTRR